MKMFSLHVLNSLRTEVQYTKKQICVSPDTFVYT